MKSQEIGEGLRLVPETHSMDVPSACTIVIIAGKLYLDNNKYIILFTNTFPSLGEYLDKVDRVMTQVDRITEDIAHMPVAAFIFRDKESDEVHYTTAIR